MKKDTKPQPESTSADRRLIETAESLIEIYKSHFGENWRSAFEQSVSITLTL